MITKMHNEEYGCILIDEIILETPSADGYLNKNYIWNNKSKRILYVYDNEGNIPHCHIAGLGKDGKKEVCVRLDAPEYFCHGEKQFKFTADEKKTFIKFMNSEDSLGIVRWKWAASTWNGFAEKRDVGKRITKADIPDYNKLDTE